MVEWIEKYQSVLGFIGGGIAAVVTAAWTVYKYWDAKKEAAKDKKAAALTTAQTVQIIGIPFDQFESALKRREDELRAELRSASGAARVEEIERTLADLKTEAVRKQQKIEMLNQLLDEMKADLVPKELDTDVFPGTLRVRSFIKGRELTVHVMASRRERIIRSVFGIIWTGGITIAAIAVGLPKLLGIPLFAGVFYLFFTRYYIRFNMQKQTVDIVAPGGAVWGRTPNPVKVEGVQTAAGWRGEVRAEGLVIATIEPKPSEHEARAGLLPFARALNWDMGIPIISTDWLRKKKPAVN
jgi:hypothetical protein